MQKLQKTQSFLILCFASIIACYVAFINKYPIVYTDTGTYIDSGFRGFVHDDRPIFYGLFIRHISLSASLWFVILFQSFLLCYIIYRSLDIFFQKERKQLVFITLIVFLTLTTGFSFNTSILLPDIFVAISVLCFINLLFNKDLNRLNKILISVIFVFGITTHLSNIPVFALLFFVIGVVYLYRYYKKIPFLISGKKLLFSLSLFTLALILIPTTHYAFSRKFQYSDNSQVFIMNHLLEMGVLENYLEENCEGKDYKICSYKSDLGWNFIWNTNSPLYKTGGVAANKDEYRQIIFDIITTPKYFILLSFKTIEYSLKQYFCFHTSVDPPLLLDSPPGGQIAWHFKDTQREYLSSKQNNSSLQPYMHNQLQSFIILSSIVFLFVSLLIRKIRNKTNPVLKWIIFIVILHSVLNAIICANTSTIDNRYQNRIVWLLPFLVIISIILYVEKNKIQFRLKDKMQD